MGDDVRWYYGAKQEFDFYKMKAPEYDEKYYYDIEKGLKPRLRRIRMAEKYSDFIFSRVDQAQLQLRPFYRWNMMVIPEQIPHNPKQRKEKPKVLHAPSNRKAKGTRYILSAFEKLKKEGVGFEVVLLENVPNEKAVEIYSDSDIIIDQLIFPGTGKFSTEGLAAGKVVMSHMNYKGYPQNNPEDCPIIDVNSDSIYQELKNIISDYDKRDKLASLGRDYVCKYLDLKIFCQTVLDLQAGKQKKSDYSPTFYRDYFVPESHEATLIYNKWNEYVSDCDWYKDIVKPGERDGLVF